MNIKKIKDILIKLCFCGVIVLSLTACGDSSSAKPKKASDINFKSSDFKDVSDVENANYVKDAKIFNKINRLSVKNQKSATTAKERSVIILKYLESLYKLSSSRVSTDLDQLYIYSDTYQNYIATLQSYCEYYGRDIATIKENIQNEDFDTSQQSLFIVVGDMESFYKKVLKQIE